MKHRSFTGHRRRERGAAVFIVVLLVTMLLGIGMFAARSASLATATSGHERQMTQAQYLAEYGVFLARAELDDTAKVQAWRDYARDTTKPDHCPSQAQMLSPRCAVYSFRTATTKLVGQSVLEPWSLGSTQITGDFNVYLSGWYKPLSPAAGTDLGLTPRQVIVTSVAVVRSAQPDAVGWMTSTQVSRAYFTTIPISGP